MFFIRLFFVVCFNCFLWFSLKRSFDCGQWAHFLSISISFSVFCFSIFILFIKFISFHCENKSICVWIMVFFLNLSISYLNFTSLHLRLFILCIVCIDISMIDSFCMFFLLDILLNVYSRVFFCICVLVCLFVCWECHLNTTLHTKWMLSNYHLFSVF